MKKLLENWNVFITEALGNYEVEVVLRAEKNTQVKDDIFEKIRAIEGVTVIKTTQATRKDETGNNCIVYTRIELSRASIIKARK